MTDMVLGAPRARGLFVLTAHPEGCRVLVERQLARARAAFEKPLDAARGRTALVLGSTTFGYGSSTAIALKAAGFEKIIGLGYETPPSFRKDKPAIASAGWYLTHALHGSGAVARTYRLSLQHAFWRYLVVGGYLSYETADYTDNPLVDERLREGLTLEYYFNPNMSVYTRYEHTDFFSTDPFGEYTENEIRVGLSIRN